MSILRRFWAVLKSNLNHWIGRAEDPEKMLNQMLLDMQEQLVTAKRQVAVAIADEKRLFAQLEQEQRLSAEWEGRAMKAVAAGSDDLARQALERQALHQKQAMGFEQHHFAQKESVDKLKASLSKLNERIEDAKRKKNLLVARAKRAEAQKTITETMNGMNDTGTFQTIDRMEEKIQQMEAEAHATEELASEIGADNLEEKFKHLDIVETDVALQALKAKMGMPSKMLGSSSDKVVQLVEIEKERLSGR